MTLSKEDLEAYANAVEMSSQRVYSVLKDVAGQFSEIARQLGVIAKLSEDTQDTMIERVAKPIMDEAKDHERDSSERCKNYSAGIKERIDSIGKDLGRAVAEVSAVVSSVKGRVEAIEKEKIQGRVSYTLIITAVTAFIGMVTNFVVLWMKSK